MIKPEYLSKYKSMNLRAQALCHGDPSLEQWFEREVSRYGFMTALNNLKSESDRRLMHGGQ